MITTDWWKKDISDKISKPNFDKDIITSLNINFGNKIFNNKFSNKYTFETQQNNVFNFLDNNENKVNEMNEFLEKNNIIFDKQIVKINENANKNLKICNDDVNDIEKEKIKEYNELIEKQKISKIKSITTKKIKLTNNLDKITKTNKIYIYPSSTQKNIINKWFVECNKVYNKCVDLYNNDKTYFNKGSYMTHKLVIFKMLYGDNDKNCPYDILTDEIRIFLSNLKSNFTNLKNKNITHFEMTHKNILKKQCIFIPKSSIKKDSFYKSHLKSMIGMKNINIENIGDSRLYYDKINKKYSISIPVYSNIKTIENKEEIVSLDPGEKIFMSYYGLNEYGHIGKDIRVEILKEEKKIRKFQRILSRKKNKFYNERLKKYKGDIKLMNENFVKMTKSEKYDTLIREKLINKKNILKKIRKCYTNIKNKVKELHNKTALYLCKNYKKILLPSFETQKMVVEKRKLKPYINQIEKEKGLIEAKKELRRISKIKRLNGRVKFCLMMLSHYKFKQHLNNKAIEYGCKVYDVSEEYTSLTCSLCGVQSKNYDNKRVKNCNCGHKVDRDINGARNILIKNIDMVLLKEGRKPEATIKP